MKKYLLYDFDFAKRIKDIEDNLVPPVIDDQDILEVSSSKDSFLKIVFAPDPVTGLPTGDLSYLVSDKANPEVKQWILDNLMLDVSSAKLPSAPNGLSDDDIIALSRDPRETVQDYMNRVNRYAKNNEELYGRMVSSLQEQSRQKQSVSDQPQETSVSSE